MTMIVGLLPKNERVTQAKVALKTAGFAESSIVVLQSPYEVWHGLGDEKKSRYFVKPLLWGMGIGLIPFGFSGLFLNYFETSVMGFAPIFGTVLLVAFLLAGLASGAFFGGIVGLCQLDEKYHSYVEGARRGEAVLVVDSDVTSVATAVSILEEAQGTAVRTLADS